jgi:rhodanese-related sulfurtransferase
MGLSEYLAQRNVVTLLDVRDRHERTAVAVPGAVVIGLHELAAQTLHGESRMVIMGSGLDDARLLRACSGLRARGGDVRVLIGGIRALAHANQRLDGTGPGLEALAWLNGAELHRFALMAPDRLVMVGGDDQLALPAMLSSAERWPLAPAGDLVQRLQRLKARMPDSSIAVITVQANDATALHAKLIDVRAERVYVLKGGLAAYTAYLNEQRRIAENAYRPLRRPCGAV